MGDLSRFVHILVIIAGVKKHVICEEEDVKDPGGMASTENPVQLLRIPFRFDGIDWDVHPRSLYYKFRGGSYECTGEFFDCIRATTPLSIVCGFNYYTWYFEDYYNQCEIVLENCQFRERKGHQPTHPRQNSVFYNGQKKRCEFYYRRASTMDEFEKLYFSMGGTTKNQVLEESGMQPPRQDLNHLTLRISQNELRPNEIPKSYAEVYNNNKLQPYSHIDLPGQRLSANGLRPNEIPKSYADEYNFNKFNPYSDSVHIPGQRLSGNGFTPNEISKGYADMYNVNKLQPYSQYKYISGQNLPENGLRPNQIPKGYADGYYINKLPPNSPSMYSPGQK